MIMHMHYEYARILPDYAAAVKEFMRCRSPEKGRPLRKWCRLYKEGKNYILKMFTYSFTSETYGSGYEWKALVTIHPDDTVTFVLSSGAVQQNSQSLTTAMWRVLPFAFERKRAGLYVIAGTKSNAVKHGGWRWIKVNAPEYFKGIRFNMLTGECLNPRRSEAERVRPVIRRHWLRDVKLFKKGLRARALLGAMEQAQQRVAEEQDKAPWVYHKLLYVKRAEDNSEEGIQMLMECIRDKRYPRVIMDRFAREAMAHNISLEEGIDRVLSRNSLALRYAYGVISPL